MAKILRVSPSGFFAWRNREGTGRRKEEELKLVRTIEDIHRSSRKTYGSPRVFQELKGLGFPVGKTKVERLMKKHGIRAKARRKFKVTTDSNHSHPVAPNILKRNFSASDPNQVWASDITYVWTKEGWLFLAVVIDLFSRQVVGWQMSERITKELTLGALKMAINRRKPGRGLIHHSDRGSQYACPDYQRLLTTHGMISSMSRKGDCWDNAVVESFFRSLKTEFIYFEDFARRAEAKSKTFEWVEVFYNRQRIHSTLGYKSPVEYEALRQVA
jgi:transposase InsO family protein